MRPAPGEQAKQWDASGLRRVDEQGLWLRFRKGTVAGNVLSAGFRFRKTPLTALRSRRAARAEGSGPPPPASPKSAYRGVYVVPAGPGDWEPLRDTLESILRYEGDDVKAVVVDDDSTDCRRERVRAEFPAVEVVRRRWPSGGPPNNYPVVADGIRFARERYSFDVLIKMDTDALVTGSSPVAAAAELFERQPETGMAGTFRVRMDGAPEDFEWDHWVLPHTERWSRSARSLMRRARAGGYDGAKIHGGIYAVSGRAVEAIAAAGDLDWRPPWWTQLGEDFWLSMVVLANGSRLGSLGGPGESFAVASKYTPVAKERVLSDRVLAIHSVRRGIDGEDEAAMRAFFRAAREGAQAEPAPSPSKEAASESSRPPGR
jgi:hypothetical protein